MEKPEGCRGCSLDETGKGFVNIEGTGTSGVLVLSDMPGDQELNEGLPLRPKSPGGSVFQGIIRRIPQLERQHLILSSMVRCQAPRNWLTGAPWEYSATDHCTRVHLAQTIQSRRPRAILALGQNVLRALTGMSGYNQNIKLLRGFQLFTNRPEFMIDGKPIPVVGTYHPIFLRRASKTRSKKGEMAVEGGATGAKLEKAEGGMALSGVMQRDVKLALQIASRGPMSPRVPKVIRGTPEVMEEMIRLWEAHPEWPMHIDIETPRSIDKAADESEIDIIHLFVKQIQFGWNEFEGYVFPGFDHEWVVRGSNRMFALPNRKYTWNGLGFDIPVLLGHQMALSGQHVDLMNAWHWIQPDIPQGLQFATSYAAPDLSPWKHLALADEDFYGANDVVAPELCRQYIWKEMERYGLVESFERHVLKLQREMHACTLRGIPMDKERHEEFGTKIGKTIAGLEVAICSAIPVEVLKLEPKRKKMLGPEFENFLNPDGEWLEYGFTRTPKEVKEHLLTDPHTNRFTLNEVVEEEQEDEDGEKVTVSKTVEVTYDLRIAAFFDKKLNVITEEPRWHRMLPFSPYSVDQKIGYIRFRQGQEIAARMAKGQPRKDALRLAKYQVPMVTNKQKKLVENSGAKELAKLAKATGDPVFTNIVAITKNNKLKGTYGPSSKWKARNGRVHPTFGLADTGTGQIASWDPNAQNAPKHGDLAYTFRRCVHADPGYCLIEIDKKSFHAQTLARLAKDKAYARITALDVHSFVTAHRLRLPEAHQILSWSDKDIKMWFDSMKESKRIFRSEAGVAYPDGMTFQEVRDFKSKKCILGIGFGQGAHSIYEQNPEGYKDKKEVQSFIDLLKELFNAIYKFQGTITALAHKQNYLVSAWGYIRRFFDVFQWDPNKWNTFTNSAGDWAHGDDYEAAVAFLPANDAFGMIKEEMLRLAGYRNEESPLIQVVNEKLSEDLLERFGLVNQIHDSLKFHCPLSLRDECLERVLGVMREPCLMLADPEMCPNGFFVDAEASMGDDWASMRKVKGV